ncbi:hypothetical protein [Deltalipothrixvirus pozzuoliense]|uniref:Uncharacterized protein ORF85 n=1 Tax=Acidianus filamentous virus 2 (isolate Italy/Pozzuoli) TaxID=654910 RepID=Y085_AFV2P|nr:hypothetical protein AFV2_gp07 [Acidianus filamentous virus 2]Q573G2.1 RecName: Full=Uncharacterized protein ORF85 [Acidianus filamentous virus 2 (isolate Pozzuoli)]CAH69394.1 hypothetical protein [Acidianus filamentous virus 2]
MSNYEILDKIRERIEKEFIMARQSRIDVVLMPMNEYSGYFYTIYTVEYTDVSNEFSSVMLTQGEYIILKNSVLVKIGDKVKQLEL